MPYAQQDDVENRLRRSLEDDEITWLSGMQEEADELVDAWFADRGCTVPDPAPSGVVLVASRIIARGLQAGTVTPGLETSTMTAGPYSQTNAYTPGTTQGGLWISKNDKALLARYCGGPRRKAINVPTA
ncbi:hypothetical protein GV792_04675 [Nocardia cyriacigeorgica]|uniref:hypothetical protein n=1 Tax=Nocardia cyriacigeorgica TaxID=135487 RepID=UPI0013B8609D|nr:hypothetical protein [Nocardia cyriacigeorgica]NEW49337.1 hypothetical protein [Nocardia cyriacigeorgica]